MEPQWSLLIPTMAHRQHKFLALLDELLPQAERCRIPVEVVALRNPGGHLPAIRQALLESARGTWLNYIDDDDMVPPWYCFDIGNVLAQDPSTDYIGFQVMKDWDNIAGIRGGPSIHRLSNPGWTTAHADYTLLNPVRASLAKACRFEHDSNHGEDHSFRNQVLPLLKHPPAREYYIDKIMYYYRWDVHDSQQTACPHKYDQECARNGHQFPYWLTPTYIPPAPPVINSPVFRWHERSYL